MKMRDLFVYSAICALFAVSCSPVGIKLSDGNKLSDDGTKTNVREDLKEVSIPVYSNENYDWEAFGWEVFNWEDFNREKAAWEAQNITNYEFTIMAQEDAWWSYTIPVQIRVSGKKPEIIHIGSTTIVGGIEDPIVPYGKTIDDIYTGIAKSANDLITDYPERAPPRIQYSRLNHYPKAYYPNKGVVVGSPKVLSVSGFRILD
jgi:hypothetical protein